jgi:hypothetical protein
MPSTTTWLLIGGAAAGGWYFLAGPGSRGGKALPFSPSAASGLGDYTPPVPFLAGFPGRVAGKFAAGAAMAARTSRPNPQGQLGRQIAARVIASAPAQKLRSKGKGLFGKLSSPFKSVGKAVVNVNKKYANYTVNQFKKGADLAVGKYVDKFTGGQTRGGA